MTYKPWQDFPILDLKYRPWTIHKDYVTIDGFRKFKLKELKNIPLNIRLSLPPKLFVKINES